MSEDTFRDEQCGATNSIPLSGATYDWIDSPDVISPPLTGNFNITINLGYIILNVCIKKN